MQNLNLQTTLPALSFDFDGLKSWALALAEKYNGLVVTEDAVVAVKQDMAELNKAKKAVDDARKEAVRRVSAPIRKFEEQIKEVTAIFDAAYSGLAVQVRAFEEKEREAKAEKVRGIIADALEARKAEVTAFPIPIQASWLNKTTTLKAVREAVETIITQRTQTETLQRQAEQARRERAAAIEQAVKAANARHGISLNVAGFMVPKFTSLDTPLEKAMAAIEDVAENAAAATKPRQGTPSPQVSPAPVAPSGPEKTMSIIITFAPANEGAVNIALNQLKKLCSSYSSRTR